MVKSKKAFSLIELSIVILIIGIIIAGVTQSSRLIARFYLQSARSLTQSSPVSSISDIVLWVETTLEGSFIDNQAQDQARVSIWYDFNLQGRKNNPSSPDSVYYPTYIESCINSLPCLRMQSSFFIFDATKLIGIPYTVIIVEQRRGSDSSSYFIGSTAGGSDQGLILGYRSDTAITFATYANDYDATVSAYSTPTPVIHVFSYTGATRTYYKNGASVTLNDLGGGTNIAAPLAAYATGLIGAFIPADAYYYNGDIGEVIIFAKSLKVEERKSIESYLSRKWRVTLSS